MNDDIILSQEEDYHLIWSYKVQFLAILKKDRDAQSKWIAGSVNLSHVNVQHPQPIFFFFFFGGGGGRGVYHLNRVKHFSEYEKVNLNKIVIDIINHAFCL